MSQAVFEITDLRVVYGFRTAVEGLSLKLERGQSLGLLGVNGAGKTSTLRALLGMVRPRAGKVELFGEGRINTKVLARIGFAPEDGQPPEFLTSEEFLRFIAALRIPQKQEREPAVKESLDYFELVPNKKIRDYSKGMRRRLLLAQAMLGNPELLILDEPLNGLDPLIIIKLRDRLERLRAGGVSMLFSSHILTEVEKACTHVAMMNEGRLVSYSPVETLVKEHGSVETAFATKVGKKS